MYVFGGKKRKFIHQIGCYLFDLFFNNFFFFLVLLSDYEFFFVCVFFLIDLNY
jgi:hypothetical protein